jgi:hypothetical protein
MMENTVGKIMVICLNLIGQYHMFSFETHTEKEK